MGLSPGISVLIVEDVQAIRFHLRTMLQEMGFSRVQTAASVEEAQLVLTVEAVDLILCDWYLNASSGLDLLRELHRGGATICMVTHDPRYADYADRSVHLFDGRLVTESAQKA